MPAIALPDPLPALNAGSNVYQPAPTATVAIPNVPIIQVTSPEPTEAPHLHKREGYLIDPCRPICGLLLQACIVPLSMRQSQWLKCDIERGLVWTSISYLGGPGTTYLSTTITRQPAPGYDEYLRTRTSTPTAFPVTTKKPEGGVACCVM